MMKLQFKIKVFEEELATAAQALESREERMQEVFKTTIFFVQLSSKLTFIRFSSVWKNVLRCLEQLQWRTSYKMGWVKRWLPSVRLALGCGC